MTKSITPKTIPARYTLLTEITVVASFTVLAEIKIEAPLALDTFVANLTFNHPVPIYGVLAPDRIGIVETVFIEVSAGIVITVLVVGFLVYVLTVYISSPEKVKEIRFFH
jgi:hypothetical protein